MEVRDLLTQYEFPGDKIPIVKGCALKALEGDAEQEKEIIELDGRGRRLHPGAGTAE